MQLCNSPLPWVLALVWVIFQLFPVEGGGAITGPFKIQALLKLASLVTTTFWTLNLEGQIHQQSCDARILISLKQTLDFKRKFISKRLCIRVNSEIYDKHLPHRNCLMDQNHVVKIADFGLSQKMFLQDYYRCKCNDTSIEFCSQTLQCTAVILKLCNAGGKRVMQSQFGGCPLSRSSTTSESPALAKKCTKTPGRYQINWDRKCWAHIVQSSALTLAESI